jgi:hypothetical protein
MVVVAKYVMGYQLKTDKACLVPTDTPISGSHRLFITYYMTNTRLIVEQKFLLVNLKTVRIRSDDGLNFSGCAPG